MSYEVLAPALAVGFVIGCVAAWRAALRDRARERRALRTDGIVTQVEYNSEHQVFPTVRFSTAPGRWVEAKPASSVNAPLFQVGQRVGLRYDPQDPSWILVDGLPGAGCVGLAVAVALTIGAVVLVAMAVVVLAS